MALKKRKLVCFVLATFIFYLSSGSSYSKQNKDSISYKDTPKSFEQKVVKEQMNVYNFKNVAVSAAVFLLSLVMMKCVKLLCPKIFKKLLSYLEPNFMISKRFPKANRLDLNNDKMIRILNRREAENLSFFVNISKIRNYVENIRRKRGFKQELKSLEEKQLGRLDGLKNFDNLNEEFNDVVQ